MSISADSLYDKGCKCLHCGHTFTSKKVRSGSQAFVKRDADFCTYYKNQNLNPILYTVFVCPACGFAFTEQFEPSMPPYVKKRIKTELADKWTPKDFGSVRTIVEAIATYKLGIYSAMLKGEAHSVLGGLYLRLAWLYRFEGDEAEERRFLNMAVREYEQSYVHSDFVKGDKEMSEVRVLYLIGELMRRVERYDQAILYFSKVIELKKKSIETGIISMAHDQWSLARQEYKEKQLGQTS